MKNLINPPQLFLFLVLCCFLKAPTSAQVMQYRDPENPARGSWQIVTNPITKNTLIRFFDGNKKQLYSETIAGKYIKLTNRNIARINQTFDQVVGKAMVATRVKAEPLSSPVFRKLTERQHKKQSKILTTQTPAIFNAKLKAHAYQVGKSSAFHLTIQNPEQERIITNLSDEQGYSLYHESFSILNYRRRFNLTGMVPGQYRLKVYTANQKQKYTRVLLPIIR